MRDAIIDKKPETLLGETTGEHIRRVLSTVGITTLVVVVAFLAWHVAHVLLLAFAGILFAVLLYSVANFLSRHTPLAGRWSLLVTLLLLLAILAGAGWLIGPRLINQSDQLSQEIPQVVDQLEQTLAQYRWGDRILERAPILEQPSADSGPPTEGPEVQQPGPTGEPSQAGDVPIAEMSVMSQLFDLVSSVIETFADLIFVVFMGIFFAANPALYRSGVVLLFPHEKRERANEILLEMGKALQWWLLGQLISMTVVGLLTALGLWLLGMPLVLVLAVIAFLMEFVPIIGPWLAAAPAILIALTQGSSQVLWVALLYFLIQQLEGNLILPLVQERAVDLPPALTLLAVFIMGALFGIIGVLVATPLLAVILVLIKMAYVHDVHGDEVKLPSSS